MFAVVYGIMLCLCGQEQAWWIDAALLPLVIFECSFVGERMGCICAAALHASMSVHAAYRLSFVAGC